MISGGGKSLRQTIKECFAVVKYRADLAMHQSGSAYYPSAKDFSNRLVAEAHSKDRCGLMKESYNLFGDSRFGRNTGSGRNHNPRRFQPDKFVDRDLVVSEHTEFRTQLAEILDKVVRERIVVIDNGNH